MSNELARIGALPVEVQTLIGKSRADSTLRAYASAIRTFVAWGGTLPTTPTEACEYIAELVRRERRPPSVRSFVAAVSWWYSLTGQPDPMMDPVVKATVAGAVRTLGDAESQAAAMTKDELRTITRWLYAADDATTATAVLVGFVSGRRGSEVVGFTVGDVAFANEGATLRLGVTKGDQTGKGSVVALPYSSDPALCPVRALRARLIEINARGRLAERTRLFPMTRATFNRKLKAAAHDAGLPRADRLSSHSLRAGFITRAAKAGAPEWAIAAQTGHRSIAVLRKYIRSARLFEDSAAMKLGL